MSENKTTNNNAKYMKMDSILQKNWIIRNKNGSELMLSGTDEQMIFNCMQEYADQELSAVKEERDRMKEALEIIQKGIKNNAGWMRLIANEALKGESTK